MKTEKYDFLVIGSGLAGLAYALQVADHLDNGRGSAAGVLILSKGEVDSGNSTWAQGGIAAVISDEDSFEQHVDDTLTAGAGLCHPDVVRHVVEQGPSRIQDLVKWGVKFDVSQTSGEDSFSLHREGGHSQRRILHVEDHTGSEIHKSLMLRARNHPNIQFKAGQYAVDLIVDRSGKNPRCVGAHVLDRKSGEVWSALAKITNLATGGAGKTYLYTSNWDGATGDGIAMAYRAGCPVGNLEFMQFHPTCLYHPEARNFLITEALRGEGGELKNAKGEVFLKPVHPLGSLAPRDIVARGIDREMKTTGAKSVFLDMTFKSRDFLNSRFPMIYDRCMKLGIDIATQPIPVVPAAHYLCGGVQVNIHGESCITGLFAIGETAMTGLHGANRLASNSLLECLVFAHNSALKSLELHPELTLEGVQAEKFAPTERKNEDELTVISHLWSEIRQLMWNYVGIVRTFRRLERAQARLDMILEEFETDYAKFSPHPDIIELRNLAMVAQLTVRSALSRKESRGVHYNSDVPETNPLLAEDSLITGLPHS